MVRQTYWLIIFPWLVSCPEKVTGIPVPLDPSFYAAAEAEHGAPGEGGGSSTPFACGGGLFSEANCYFPTYLIV